MLSNYSLKELIQICYVIYFITHWLPAMMLTTVTAFIDIYSITMFMLLERKFINFVRFSGKGHHTLHKIHYEKS